MNPWNFFRHFPPASTDANAFEIGTARFLCKHWSMSLFYNHSFPILSTHHEFRTKTVNWLYNVGKHLFFYPYILNDSSAVRRRHRWLSLDASHCWVARFRFIYLLLFFFCSSLCSRIHICRFCFMQLLFLPLLLLLLHSTPIFLYHDTVMLS